MEIKKAAEEQKIWNNNKKVARLEEEMKKLVPKQFHKQIKLFGKKVSERMPMRKMWDHAIVCVKERENLSLVQQRKRRSERVYSEAKKEEIYLTIKVTTDCTIILCRKEGWKEENGTRLLIYK